MLVLKPIYGDVFIWFERGEDDKWRVGRSMGGILIFLWGNPPIGL